MKWKAWCAHSLILLSALLLTTGILCYFLVRPLPPLPTPTPSLPPTLPLPSLSSNSQRIIYTKVFPSILSSALKTQLAIPTKLAQSYPSYANNSGGDPSQDTPLYEVYTMWNLTNMEAVNRGAKVKPSFERIGTFTYRNVMTHLNPSFSPDGETVSSIWGETYFHVGISPYTGQPEASPYSTMITNINPTYMGVLDTAGSDKDLKVIVTGGAIGAIIDWVNGPYRDYVATPKVAPALTLALELLLANAPQTLNCSNTDHATTLGSAPPKCQASFCAAFANNSYDLSLLDPLWAGLQILDPPASGQNGLSLPACLALFDPDTPFSLAAPDADSISLWQDVRIANQTALTLLSHHLHAMGVSPTQLESLLSSFLPRLQSAYIHVHLCNEYSLPSIEFFGYEQWARASITNQVPLHTLFPHLPIFRGVTDTPFEFNLALDPLVSTDWMTGPRAAILLNGTLRGGYDNGLLSTNGLVDFLTAAVPPQPGVLAGTYNLVGAQVVDVLVYGLKAVESYGAAYARELVESNAGLFITKSVDQWLFDCHDALLDVVQPGGICALITNTTSLEWAVQNTPPDTINTGYADLSAVYNYIKYQEQTAIPWNNYDAPVYGTDGAHFPPGMFHTFDPSTLIKVFETDLVRPISLAYRNSFDVHGITLHRFTPLHELFLPDERFFQRISGFANMTQTEQAPIFFSYPNMYLCDPDYVAKVDGMNPSPADEAAISVEPITGLTMDAHKRIQVNVFVDPSLGQDGFAEFNPEFHAVNMFFPLFTVDETATIPPNLAKEFRDSVYVLRDLRLGLLIGCVILSLCALVTALYAYYSVYFRAREPDVVIPVSAGGGGGEEVDPLLPSGSSLN